MAQIITDEQAAYLINGTKPFHSARHPEAAEVLVESWIVGAELVQRFTDDDFGVWHSKECLPRSLS